MHFFRRVTSLRMRFINAVDRMAVISRIMNYDRMTVISRIMNCDRMTVISRIMNCDRMTYQQNIEQ
jgi:hypothetical protein